MLRAHVSMISNARPFPPAASPRHQPECDRDAFRIVSLGNNTTGFKTIVAYPNRNAKQGKGGSSHADTGWGKSTGSPSPYRQAAPLTLEGFPTPRLSGCTWHSLRQRAVRRAGEMPTRQERLKGNPLLGARRNGFVHLQEGQDDSGKLRRNLKLQMVRSILELHEPCAGNQAGQRL